MCRATKDCGGWSYCNASNGGTCPGNCKALQSKYYTTTTNTSTTSGADTLR